MHIRITVINVIFIQVIFLNCKGKHGYSQRAQTGLTFLSNLITLIDEFYDRVMVRLELSLA
jgi:hypothetical protein